MPESIHARLRPLAAMGLVLAMTMSLFVALAATRTPEAAATTRSERVALALRVALDQRGDRYLYGAAGPDRFDCSGLTTFAYKTRSGFAQLPRTAGAQAASMRRIAKKALRKGDFIFFRTGSQVTHVGIFAGWRDGKRQVLHSPGTGDRVRIDRVWTTAWTAGTLRY